MTHVLPMIGRVLQAFPKVELHQHVDGSIPVDVTWCLMRQHNIAPVESKDQMERKLVLQEEEEGSLLAYLDKFHYPLWITQFYENISQVSYEIVREAARYNVRVLELRYSPIIHMYAGLSMRQAIGAVLDGLNRAREELDVEVGLIVIAMRHLGPHIASILARQAVAESVRLHTRTGVVGFDIAGAERGNPPKLFRKAYEIARKGGLGLTAHAGEDEGPEMIWQAIDELGVKRVGHGCSAIDDAKLMQRLARDQILIECCLTSNFQTGAVKRGQPHPVFRFLEAGVPVAICTDNTTVSSTNQLVENALLLERLGADTLAEIHQQASRASFIPSAVEAMSRGQASAPASKPDPTSGNGKGQQAEQPPRPDKKAGAKQGATQP